jgi:oxalate decarboxylase
MTDVRARRDFDGGTFKLATVDEWPISKTMSGGLMVIGEALSSQNSDWL